MKRMQNIKSCSVGLKAKDTRQCVSAHTILIGQLWNLQRKWRLIALSNGLLLPATKATSPTKQFNIDSNGAVKSQNIIPTCSLAMRISERLTLFISSPFSTFVRARHVQFVYKSHQMSSSNIMNNYSTNEELCKCVFLFVSYQLPLYCILKKKFR